MQHNLKKNFYTSINYFAKYFSGTKFQLPNAFHKKVFKKMWKEHLKFHCRVFPFNLTLHKKRNVLLLKHNFNVVWLRQENIFCNGF